MVAYLNISIHPLHLLSLLSRPLTAPGLDGRHQPLRGLLHRVGVWLEQFAALDAGGVRPCLCLSTDDSLSCCVCYVCLCGDYSTMAQFEFVETVAQ